MIYLLFINYSQVVEFFYYVQLFTSFIEYYFNV